MSLRWKIKLNSAMEYLFVPLPIKGDDQWSIKIPKQKLLENLRVYPGLWKIFPASGRRIGILSNVTENALRNLIQFLISGSCIIDDWKVALETYFTATTYEVKLLKYICEEFFAENPITEENVHEVHRLAAEMGINPISQATTKFLHELDYLHDSYESSSHYCFVMNSKYMEPLELNIPLKDIELITLRDAFLDDVINEINLGSFSMKGIYHIIGIQINLKPSEGDNLFPVDIYVDICNDEEHIRFQEYRSKVASSVLVIKFRQELILRPEQMASICVTIHDVKPRYCSTVEQEAVFRKNEERRMLRATLKTNRTSLCKKEGRYFIEKVFYLP